jgi:hypothetical protein
MATVFTDLIIDLLRDAVLGVLVLVAVYVVVRVGTTAVLHSMLEFRRRSQGPFYKEKQ